MPRTQANEVSQHPYSRGPFGPIHPVSTSEADAKRLLYYWYDGCMPYCTNATGWRPLDDTFLYTNMSWLFVRLARHHDFPLLPQLERFKAVPDSASADLGRRQQHWPALRPLHFRNGTTRWCPG